MEIELSRTRDVSQWKSIRDGDQISQEIQHLVRYYMEGFVSKEKLKMQYIETNELGGMLCYLAKTTTRRQFVLITYILFLTEMQKRQTR